MRRALIVILVLALAGSIASVVRTWPKAKEANPRPSLTLAEFQAAHTPARTTEEAASLAEPETPAEQTTEVTPTPPPESKPDVTPPEPKAEVAPPESKAEGTPAEPPPTPVAIAPPVTPPPPTAPPPTVEPAVTADEAPDETPPTPAPTNDPPVPVVTNVSSAPPEPKHPPGVSDPVTTARSLLNGRPSGRITVHYHSDPQSRSTAERLSARLDALDPGKVTLVTSAHTTSSPVVRYFERQDGAIATALVRLLNADAVTWQVEDCTTYRHKPDTGTIQVWPASVGPVRAARNN